MEMKGGDLMLSVIEKYVEEIKENKKRFNEEGVEYASKSIYNVAAEVFDESGFEERNEMRDVFEKNNKFNRMVDLCKYLISQPSSSPEQKRITDYVSLAICFLLKSEKPSLSLGCILSYVDDLKTSPPHPNGFDVSRNAKDALNSMVGADECLSAFSSRKAAEMKGVWKGKEGKRNLDKGEKNIFFWRANKKKNEDLWKRKQRQRQQRLFSPPPPPLLHS
jgi:hypothetical protein